MNKDLVSYCHRLLRALRFAPFAISVLFAGVLSSCTIRKGDPPEELVDRSSLGSSRIQDYVDPKAPSHLSSLESEISIEGVQVTAIDTYDETKDGSSIGTIYVQDWGSNAPFSALSLYSPRFTPAHFHVIVSDVVDLIGLYTEPSKLGTSVDFNKNSTDGVLQHLTQLFKPVGKLRFDGDSAEIVPTEISIDDLSSYATGYRWMNKLVTLKNVRLLNSPFTDKAGRTTTQIVEGVAKNSPSISNELCDYKASRLKKGMRVNVTGIVTYFFTLKIAPRTEDDLEVIEE